MDRPNTHVFSVRRTGIGSSKDRTGIGSSIDITGMWTVIDRTGIGSIMDNTCPGRKWIEQIHAREQIYHVVVRV